MLNNFKKFKTFALFPYLAKAKSFINPSFGFKYSTGKPVTKFNILKFPNTIVYNNEKSFKTDLGNNKISENHIISPFLQTNNLKNDLLKIFKNLNESEDLIHLTCFIVAEVKKFENSIDLLKLVMDKQNFDDVISKDEIIYHFQYITKNDNKNFDFDKFIDIILSSIHEKFEEKINLFDSNDYSNAGMVELDKEMLLKIMIEKINEDDLPKFQKSFKNTPNYIFGGKRNYSTSSILNEDNKFPQNDYKLNKNTPFLSYSPVYLKVKDIFQDINKNPFEKQKEIENLINDEWLNLYLSKNNNENSQDKLILLNLAMKEFIKELDIYFQSNKKFETITPLIELNKGDIAIVVFNELKPILNSGEEMNIVTFSGNIGKSLYERWYRTLYLKELNHKKKIALARGASVEGEDITNFKFNLFKENLINQEKINFQKSNNKKNNLDFDTNNLDFINFKSNSLDFINFKTNQYHKVGNLLSNLLLDNSNLFYKRYDKTDPKDTKILITLSTEVRQIFKHHYDIIGLKLPMVCSPIKWDNKNYGGYIKNNDLIFSDLITPSFKSNIKSEITNKLIYDSVNYLSSIPYNINKDVLNFINLYGDKIGIISDLHVETKNLELYYSYLNKTKKDIILPQDGENKKSKFMIKKTLKEILSYNSNYYLQKNILGLANLYKELEQFYFTINLDWRGRLYSESSYLNFQGNELSKALILFKNGKILTNDGLFYLKIYGANLYGINKLSFEDRIKWVDNNEKNIINMDIDFINKADKKFIFIAFCFEYKKYLENPINFKTHFPILLDASCNGMQHLSAMIGDSIIAKNVNLLENDPHLKPYDFYEFCLNLVKNKLNSKKGMKYIRIKKLELNRKVVKTSIMTIPYNVTIHKMCKQLYDAFEPIEINNEKLLKPKWYQPEPELYISYQELYYLAELIHETLYEEHPKLKAVVNYFSEMATFLTELNLPIIWNTPAGLKVKQNYIKFKKHTIKSSLYYKSSSYTITLPTSQISLKNQKSSFMPNLIHSMDASNIYLLGDKILKANLDINLFTVHDCFATTAESMPLLNRLVRSSFIELYSDNEYLNKMNNFYRNYLIDNNFIIVDNKVILEKEEKEIPQPPISENLNLNDMIDKAIYLIH